MIDFVSIYIKSKLSNEAVYELLSSGLPSFSWRRGDSDAQGTYVSGLDSNRVKIQCWTGEDPMGMSISFRSTNNMDENARIDFVNVVMNSLVPKIGVVNKRKDIHDS